eukprot:4985837-Heterocapsa_arctica.AAC.1
MAGGAEVTVGVADSASPAETMAEAIARCRASQGRLVREWRVQAKLRRRPCPSLPEHSQMT